MPTGIAPGIMMYGPVGQFGPNLLTPEQYSFEGGTTAGWVGFSNCSVANVSSTAFIGLRSLSMTSVAAGAMNAIAGPNVIPGMIPVTPGIAYTVSAAARAGGLGQVITLGTYTWTPGGSAIGYTPTQQLGTDGANWTVFNSNPIVFGPNVGFAQPVLGTANTAGANEIHYFDAVQLMPGVWWPS